MRTWTKLLVVGWSILCIGIIVVSFQIMKKDYVAETYSIWAPLLVPEKVGDGVERLAAWLYPNQNERFLSKEQFIERVKGAKGVELKSEHTVKNKAIYLYLPIYSFVVWAFPILVFVAVGRLFEKNPTNNKSDTSATS
ncbi:MAG: hypothetical protein HY787_06710 [Deltaproteobacteria bacterium]|nr:hypothetical protein [Deltaproteobacteria bacterium]